MGLCRGVWVGAPTLRVARITVHKVESVMEACRGFGNKETVPGRSRWVLAVPPLEWVRDVAARYACGNTRATVMRRD